MKRALLFILILFFVSCSRVREEPKITFVPSSDTYKGRVTFDINVKDGQYYYEKVTVLKQKLSFKCVSPDTSFIVEENIKRYFPDFDIGFSTESPTVKLTFEPKFYAKLQGGLVFRSNYLVKVALKCEAEIEGKVYDCSSVAWGVYNSNQMDRFASYCPDHPVEYVFVYKILPEAVNKSLIRVRKALLEAKGFSIDSKLASISDEIEEQWYKYAK